MSLLAKADAKYRAATNLSLDRISVRDPLVNGCWTATTALIRRIDVRERPAVWSAARNATAALRWSLLTRPLHALGNRTDVDIALDELRSEARGLAGTVDTAVLGELHQVITAGEALGVAADELADQIVASVQDGPGNGTCVVLVGTAARRAAESALALRLPGVRFLVPRQFLGGRLWDKAVVVGVSLWYPDELFTAPRCVELVLVHHRWLRDRPHVAGLFADAGGEGLRAVLPPQNEATIGREVVRSPTESVDWSGIEPVGGKPQDSDPSDDVPARLVLLAGGYGFYLDQDADTIRGLDPACIGGRWIKPMPATDLGPDSVVVLRRGISERETLRPRVSEILGERENAVREHQTQWKDKLAATLASGGLQSLRRTLSLPDLTSQYARYWAGPNSISPRRPTFVKLLDHLGVTDVPGCLDAAKQLYSAHHEAGRQLARELERSVDGAMVYRLGTEDWVPLSAGQGTGSVRATLFKVVAISPEPTIVPAAALRTALKLKGTEWLG